MVQIIKKDLSVVPYNANKIIAAVQKSANRVVETLTDEELNKICELSLEYINSISQEFVKVSDVHKCVEKALDQVNPVVAQSYKDYRNYKTDFVGIMDRVYQKAQSITYRGDKENSNTDSTLITTKRSLVYSELNRELYEKFFLTSEEKAAIDDGYIYIHDRGARLDSPNCCLFDSQSVMYNGFEMGNMWYNEPTSVDVACDVLGDIIMMSASMQYGGWSTRVDNLLAPFAEKSYIAYKNEYLELGVAEDIAEKKAIQKVRRELEQGIQGLEYKLNSVASSRGDYPFVTFALGVGSDRFEKMVSEAVLRVRMGGQGKKGNKKPVLFPKLVFLYDEELHGEGGVLEDLFELGIECSSKCMYPDFLSLTGEGYVPSMYKKYGEIVYPMGKSREMQPM